MTITNTIKKSYQDLSTKTEIDIIDENNVMCSRVINSKLFTYLISQENLVTVKYVANLTKIDNELFIALSKTQMSD